MVVTTFLYIIIILGYVNKLNNLISNFAGFWVNPKQKDEAYLGIFFLPT
jgi:hypothetical protein